MADLLPVAAWSDQADSHCFHIGCRGCHRSVSMGVRRAVRQTAGRSTEAWLACMRCTRCGHRGAHISVAQDVRTAEAKQRDGPLPVCLET